MKVDMYISSGGALVIRINEEPIAVTRDPALIDNMAFLRAILESAIEMTQRKEEEPDAPERID